MCAVVSGKSGRHFAHILGKSCEGTTSIGSSLPLTAAPGPGPWVRPDRTGRSGGGQGAKPAKGGGEQRRPRPGALEAEEDAATAAGHAAGDVEESMAERLGFPAARVAVQAEALEEG